MAIVSKRVVVGNRFGTSSYSPDCCDVVEVPRQ